MRNFGRAAARLCHPARVSELILYVDRLWISPHAEAQWLRPSVRKFTEQARPPFVPYY